MSIAKQDFLNHHIDLYKSNKLPLISIEIETEDEYALDDFFTEPDYLINIEKTFSTTNKLSLFFNEPTTWKYDYKSKLFKVNIKNTQEQFILNKENWRISTRNHSNNVQSG